MYTHMLYLSLYIYIYICYHLSGARPARCRAGRPAAAWQSLVY